MDVNHTDASEELTDQNSAPKSSKFDDTQAKKTKSKILQKDKR
jgi:hypothetical protein